MNSNTKLIYCNGHRVGLVSGDKFKKTLHSGKHFLKYPQPAIAFDCDTLNQAHAAGARVVIVKDSDTGKVYRAQLATILQSGFTFDRGFGKQIALTLSRWEVISAENEAIQLDMFRGIAW